jgi:PAS domain S-box-containing protein
MNSLVDIESERQSWRVGDRLDAEHARDDPFVAAVRGARMAMVVTDARQPGLPLVFVNDAFLKLTGYAREEVIGKNGRFLQGPDTDPEAVAEIRRAVAEGRDAQVEILNYRKDGTSFWNLLYLSPVRDAAGEIAWFFGSQLDITDRKRAQLDVLEAKAGLAVAVEDRTRDLQRALDQKTVLLHEVDHRVKNNLQLMSSLILLQMRRSADPAVKEALQNVLDRVTAISTVHRRLFQGEDVGRFDVADFIVDLTDDLGAGAAKRGVDVELRLHPVSVPAGRAAPVALIVNELISNALSHAFPEGRKGKVCIALEATPEGYRFEVKDDGVGIDPSAAGADGGGRYIVELLARQLKATVEWKDGDPGTHVSMAVPVEGAS